MQLQHYVNFSTAVAAFESGEVDCLVASTCQLEQEVAAGTIKAGSVVVAQLPGVQGATINLCQSSTPVYASEMLSAHRSVPTQVSIAVNQSKPHELNGCAGAIGPSQRI
jgi:hypothetical protein